VKKSINDVIHSLIARVSFSLTGNQLLSSVKMLVFCHRQISGCWCAYVWGRLEKHG